MAISGHKGVSPHSVALHSVTICGGIHLIKKNVEQHSRNRVEWPVFFKEIALYSRQIRLQQLFKTLTWSAPLGRFQSRLGNGYVD